MEYPTVQNVTNQTIDLGNHMANKKTIRLYSYSYLPLDQSGDKYTVSWDDVWVRLKINNKKVFQAGPCINAGIDEEIKRAKLVHDAMTKKCFDSTVWHSELTLLEKIRDLFSQGHMYYCESDKKIDKLPNIYINKTELTKKDAEDAIEWWLRKIGLLKSVPRFQWNKPSFCITPI